MKIVIINLERGWRGGERQTLYNAIGLLGENIDIQVICRSGSDLEKALLDNRIQVIPVSSYIKLFFKLLFLPSNVDFVLCQSSKSLTFAYFSSFINRAKLLLFRRLDFVPKGNFTIRKYKACSKIFCVSEAVKNILINIGIENTTVIPDCIVSKNLNIERGKLLLNNIPTNDKIIIGTTAALVQHKDPLNMVQAIAELRKKREDFVFVHFGDGELKNDVIQKIKELNLENHYFLMGFVPDVEDVFSVLDVFVMSSEEEGMGSSVLDAFIYKVPVVSTNAGGLEETVQNRGVLVEKKNSQELAKGILYILENEEIKLKNLEEAYNFVSTKLDIKTVHKKLKHELELL